MSGKVKNIVIDRGNTRTKAILYEHHTPLAEYNNPLDKELVKIVKQERPDFVMVSSVKKGVKKLLNTLRKYAHTEVFTFTTPLPFHNGYLTPETLGTDRLAGIAGAYFLYPGKNCLLIDAGTCITYDFIDADGNYHGGGIAPGIKMKFKALKKYTSGLPLIAFKKKEVDLIGKNTKQCILSGVINGTLAEIEGVINRYKQYFDDLVIIIAGGDTKFFESNLKGHIFAEPKLVLIGLNRILLNNVNTQK